jgi:hypothetical protein
MTTTDRPPTTMHAAHAARANDSTVSHGTPLTAGGDYGEQ